MSPKLSIRSNIELSDGAKMPHIGLGVYEMDEDETYAAVRNALEAGYRLIDTAAWYYNEAPCTKAIKEFCSETGTPRSDIFYVTKLQYNEGRAATRSKIAKSLELAPDYIDLYLVHGPPGGPQLRRESWEEVVNAKKAGQLRSIGVSNFGVRHLNEIRTNWGEAKVGDDQWAGEKPTVNQVDFHPFYTHDDIVDFGRKHDIALQAWAPLVRAMRFDHPVVKRLSNQYKKSPAQILLRYSIQQGFAPVPKSVSKKRILENIDIFDFELSSEEVDELHGLNENLVTDWDVVDCP